MRVPRKGSQKRESRTITRRRLRFWAAAVRYLTERWATGDESSALLCTAFQNYIAMKRNYNSYIARGRLISTSSFEEVFQHMGDEQCIIHFWFLRADLLKVLEVVTSGMDKYTTRRNTYFSTRILATCILLKRLSTPQRWSDLKVMFRKHSPQLSEIFWECIDDFIHRLGYLLTGPIATNYTASKAEYWAAKVKDRVGAFDNCVGYIDGTVIEIARPKDSALQNVVYNGHKRKHALKFQAVTTADGMFYHVYGPVEGRRHDRTLYSRSGLDAQLEEVICVDNHQYCIFGDSGYNMRVYLEFPFQGSNLNADQSSFNQPSRQV